MNDDNRKQCSSALAALNETLQKQPDELEHGLEEALSCIVRLRDDCIERTRGAAEHAGDELKRVNAILSMVVGSEYPVAGIRKDNVTKARDALAKLLAEAKH